ncbi:MAG: aldehyde ferredoxin oxidoreductase family protein [Desulfuromonadales bacterium]|nr:aldehyde ferredoxin oxidoreductase family protein [Desulfuromonadales bacterium]MDT8423121.1 aldehyde ferredoxin oxidoreductase family protein [Desulfuromonadales bacterium]
MFGWHGRLLQVDLSAGRARTESLPEEWLHHYLGGRGIAVRLFRDFFQTEPYSPEMPLIFATGPLCATAAPTAERMAVVSRSPLTRTLYDCSVGGRFAQQLKCAGFDVVQIVGRAAVPMVLAITPSGAELLPADSLWGSTVPTTIAALNGRGSVVAIGPAGEHLVPFATIITDDGNAADRGGLGAVMGSKRLKAVVVSGAKLPEIADPARFERAHNDILRLFRAAPVLFGELGFGAYGTPTLVDLLAQRRMTPTENFRKTFFAAAANYSGPALRAAYAPHKVGCCGCPLQCQKVTADGAYLPGYEALSHFGALNNIGDLAAIITAIRTCHELGLDPVSAAATLATWGEVRGAFVTEAELVPLLRDLVWRRGAGEPLCVGSRQLALAAGKPEVSMSVKGLELPAYDPRGAYGMALAYCTNNHGGCHLGAYPLAHEILRKPAPTDRFSFAGKARMIKIAEDINAAVDSLVACKFAFLGAGIEEYAELLAAVTGVDFTPERLKEIGECIYLTERWYNDVNGFSVIDDCLPERFFREAGSRGDGIEVPPLDRARFDEELQKYYRMRGLDAHGRFVDRNFLVSLTC